MSRHPSASITERFAWQPRSAFSLGLSAEELGVFCYLSNMATFKDLDMTTRAGKLKLLPGQLYSTIRQLGEQLKITKDKVARVLKKLSEMGLITMLKTATKTATHGTIVSVCHLTKFPPDALEPETSCATNSRQECDTNKKRETRNKEDSCRSQAIDDSHKVKLDPFGDDADEADGLTGAGPSTEAAGAGPEQPSANANAGSPPVPPPPSRKVKAKRESSVKTLVPEDWVPSEKAITTFMEERKATRRQAELQIRHFVTTCHAKGMKYVKHDMAWLSWMRGPHYKPISEGNGAQKTYAQQRYEMEYSI